MAVLNDSLSYFEQMDEVQFKHWTSLLERRTGMHLPTERCSFLETSLGLRMKEIGVDTFAAYYQHLHSEKNGESEWLTLVDRLTVHETSFFRHQPSFDFFEKIILTQIFKSEPDRKKLQIWSAGCSTGEEAYTLCMIADQFMNQSAASSSCYLAVTGMDISIPALMSARKAVYNKYQIRHIPERYLSKYFCEKENQRYEVVDALKKRMCFVSFNLIDMKKTVLEPMDVIFCQNVLIYFDRERRNQIIHQLVQRLKPGGFLVLGAGESLNNVHPELEKIDYSNALAFSKKIIGN